MTIEGEPGAVICGSDPIGPWQPAGEGLWQVADWTGTYAGPDDVNERDERANPTHLLFVDDYPLDYVKTKAELVPGTWHLEPLLGWRAQDDHHLPAAGRRSDQGARRNHQPQRLDDQQVQPRPRAGLPPRAGAACAASAA